MRPPYRGLMHPMRPRAAPCVCPPALFFAELPLLPLGITLALRAATAGRIAEVTMFVQAE